MFRSGSWGSLTLQTKMKILSWNCRGMNNPETLQALYTWCCRERPDFVFIIESMIDSCRLEGIRNKRMENYICHPFKSPARWKNFIC